MRNILSFLAAITLCVLFARASAQSTTGNETHVDSTETTRRTQKAIDSLTQIISGTRDKQIKAVLYVKRGLQESILGQSKIAVSDYTSAVDLNPTLRDAYTYRAMEYKGNGNYIEGIADLRKALGFSATNTKYSSMLYSDIALMELRLKNYGQVLKSDSIALELDPNNSLGYAYNGWAYYYLTKYEKAIECYSAAISSYSKNPDVSLSELIAARGDAKRYLKKYNDAINDYSQAINLDPDNRHARWNRAACYSGNGDYQLADTEYTKTMGYYAGDVTNLALLYYDRAKMEINEQKFSEALHDDSVSLSYNNKYGPAYWRMADAYALSADFQKSMEWYKQTLKYYTGKKPALSALNAAVSIQAYFLKQYDEVINSSTIAIGLDEKAWGPYLDRGRGYLKLGKKDKAIGDFKQILALDTTKKSYEYAYALFYTGNTDKAIEIMQNNIINTTNPAVLMGHYYNIACLYALMNKPDEANIYLKKCFDEGYSKKYAQFDSDFDNVRDTPAFKALINAK
ncbi:MAG TPA: tetratricopeptide repeat protein [Mucilaginibacter sp.]|jgi:tetratricopeptide (TPR) repeat protein|nr:tetratricopeptide repeat protein [Mucilaginibacter sp.]